MCMIVYLGHCFQYLEYIHLYTLILNHAVTLLRSCSVVGINLALHADNQCSIVACTKMTLKPWASFLNGFTYRSHKPKAYE